MQTLPIPEEQETADKPFTRRLAELIAASLADDGSNARTVELAELLEDSPELDSAMELITVIIDGLSSRPRLSTQEIERLLEPLTWGLLNRANF